MKARIAKVRAFVKEVGVSQNYLSEVVFEGTVSRSYVSKLLSNHLEGVQKTTLQIMVDTLEKWVDVEEEKVHVLYAELWQILSAQKTHTQRIALSRLLGDL